MRLHDLGQHLVLAGQLGFKLFDPLVLAVHDGLGLAAVVERGITVLEELFQPSIKLRGVELQFIAQIGDGHLVEQVPRKTSDLLSVPAK